MSEQQEPKAINPDEGQSASTGGLGKKMCLICEHFRWESLGISCGSEETGCWIEGGASCDKQHYYVERPEKKRDLLALFLRAEKCKDYTPNAEVRGCATTDKETKNG